MCSVQIFAQTATASLIEQAQSYDRTERQELLDLLNPPLANGVFDNFPEEKLEAIRLVTNAYLKLGKMAETESSFMRLRAEAHKYDNPFYLGKSYFFEGEMLGAQGKLQEALDAKEAGYQVFLSTDNKTEIAHMLVEISSGLRVMGRYSESLQKATEARRISESIEDIYGVASAYNALSMSHSLVGNYGRALEAMLQTLALDKQAGEDSEMATTLYNIADIYERMNDIEMAKRYYLEALKMDSEDKNPEHIGFDYVALGNIERKLENFGKARTYLLKALDAFKQIESGKNIAWTYNSLARVDLKEDDLENAESHIRNAWTHLKKAKVEDEVNHIDNRLLAAELALKRTRLKAAHDYLDEVEELAVEQQSVGKLQELFTLRSNIFVAQENYAEALAAYQQYHQLTTRINQESRAVTIANLQNSIDYLHQEHQIGLLENEKTLKETQLATAKSQRNAWIAILTSVVFIFGAIGYREYTRRKVTTQHRQMAEELVDKKNEMLAEVAHELRSPLTALKLQIETLEYNLEDNPKAAYNRLNKKVTELNQLIDDLYQLARADNGLLQLDMQEVPLLEIVEEVTEGYVEVLQHQGLTLKTEIQVSPHDLLRCDANRLKQVLVNLLRNSLHYTDAPGEVRCTVKRKDDSYYLVVEDSAPDVDELELKRLFERLYRADLGKSNDTGGAGLGLSICKSLIEAHGGNIVADKSDLGGLKITMTLPSLLNTLSNQEDGSTKAA
ncbi:MAG: tetratricopeptide repeat protein [Aestuariibacter sp.]